MEPVQNTQCAKVVVESIMPIEVVKICASKQSWRQICIYCDDLGAINNSFIYYVNYLVSVWVGRTLAYDLYSWNIRNTENRFIILRYVTISSHILVIQSPLLYTKRTQRQFSYCAHTAKMQRNINFLKLIQHKLSYFAWWKS